MPSPLNDLIQRDNSWRAALPLMTARCPRGVPLI
jgi:hypothetical protein